MYKPIRNVKCSRKLSLCLRTTRSEIFVHDGRQSRRIMSIHVSLYIAKSIQQLMYSFCFLKKHLQPEAIYTSQANFTTKLYPVTHCVNLSLTYSYVQFKATSGLPVVVDSYPRMLRCFHQLFATKNCLRSYTEKKRR